MPSARWDEHQEQIIDESGGSHAMTASPRFRAATAWVGAAFLMAATQACADSTATASLTNIHIQLVDLDLSDGIAPAVTFHTDPTALVALTKVGSDNWIQTYTTGSQGDALGPWAAQVEQVSVSGSLLAGDLRSGTGPGVLAYSSVGSFDAGGWAYGFAIQGLFTLTANTRLVITADVSVDVSGGLGTSAFAYGKLEFYSLDFSNRFYANLQASVYPENGVPYLPAPGVLQTSFENLTGASVDGWVYANASAYVTTAVPEPASYALMLAGLGLLCRVTRGWRA